MKHPSDRLALAIIASAILLVAGYAVFGPPHRTRTFQQPPLLDVATPLPTVGTTVIPDESTASNLTTDEARSAQEQELRDQVLKAEIAREAGKAYEKYFRHVGVAGLRRLVADKYTGIALHAAWEVYRKPAKRPKPDPNLIDRSFSNRTENIYDRGELAKFQTILKNRIKAPIPVWWSAGIIDVDLFPDQHHAFGEACWQGQPRLRYLEHFEHRPCVHEGADLELVGDVLRYTVGGRSVDFSAAIFEDFSHCYVGLVGEKQSFVATFSSGGGFPYKLACLAGKGGKPVWTTEVWAAGRLILMGKGVHRLELAENDDTLFVFGAESHGMYLEAFDSATGKCRYRFCTGYWFNFSEGWDLK